MISKIKKDIISAVFFLIFGAVIITVAKDIPKGLSTGFGAQSFPLFCGIAMIVLSLILLLQSMVQLKKYGGKAVKEDGKAKPSFQWTFYNPYIQVLLSFLLVIMYNYLLKPLGYLVVTPVFLFFMILLVAPESERKPIKFAIIATVTSAIIYIIFRYGFSVQLPMGILK